jgi:DNA-binding response OmpR family regulator
MASHTTSILVVDDDASNRAMLRLACEGLRAGVIEASTGTDALRLIVDAQPDLVLLDIGLPDISGLEVCRRVRAAGITTPILVISGRADLVDVVLGIELGADDYIRKPYNVRELLARVSAQLRRAATPRPQPDGPLELGGLSIDLRGHRVCRDGAEIGLTLTEFNLLALLAARHGDIVSRSEMLTTIWEHTPEVDPRTIDAHIHRLRRKLEQGSPGYCYIDTVPGVGYRFAQPLAAPEAAGLCLVA